MHILHVIDSLAVGGAERMLVEIGNATVQDGHQVTACITRTNADLAFELDPRISLIRLNRTSRFDIHALRSFGKIISKRDIDIIHVHGRSSLSFVIASKLMWSHSIPIILHDHRSIGLDRNVPIWFSICASKMLGAYIGVYEELRYWAISAGIPESKIFVIGNGINMKRFQEIESANLPEELGLKTTTLVGIVVGGLRKEKGIDLLIESLTRCDESDFKIVIVGGERDSSYVQECKKIAEQKGLARHLIFTGERPDVLRLLMSVDFALIPSRSESGPIVLLEYMAMGIPFVAFRVGEIGERSAQSGIEGFVNVGDTHAFAASITKLVRLSPKERIERGLTGRNFVYNNFSIESKMPLFFEVYDKVCCTR